MKSTILSNFCFLLFQLQLCFIYLYFLARIHTNIFELFELFAFFFFSSTNVQWLLTPIFFYFFSFFVTSRQCVGYDRWLINKYYINLLWRVWGHDRICWSENMLNDNPVVANNKAHAATPRSSLLLRMIDEPVW